MTNHHDPKSFEGPSFYPESESLKEDLQRLADTQLEKEGPHDLLESIEYLGSLTEVDVSSEFDFVLRQKIDQLKQEHPRKETINRLPLWRWGTVAAVVLLTVIWMGPHFEAEKHSSGADEGLVTAYLSQLSVDESLFGLEAGRFAVRRVSEVDLSQEALDYPVEEIHDAPVLSF